MTRKGPKRPDDSHPAVSAFIRFIVVPLSHLRSWERVPAVSDSYLPAPAPLDDARVESGPCHNTWLIIHFPSYLPNNR